MFRSDNLDGNKTSEDGGLDIILLQVETIRRKRLAIRRNIENLNFEIKQKTQLLDEKIRTKNLVEKESCALGSEVTAGLGRVHTLQECFSSRRRLAQQIQLTSEQHVMTVKQQGTRKLGILDDFTSSLYTCLQPLHTSLLENKTEVQVTKRQDNLARRQEQLNTLKANNDQLERKLQQETMNIQDVQEYLKHQVDKLRDLNAEMKHKRQEQASWLTDEVVGRHMVTSRINMEQDGVSLPPQRNAGLLKVNSSSTQQHVPGGQLDNQYGGYPSNTVTGQGDQVLASPGWNTGYQNPETEDMSQGDVLVHSSRSSEAHTNNIQGETRVLMEY